MAIVALDQKTAKFLTTAQVVTSVSTAVKELVENALDGGANSIHIKLVENGMSLIEVCDDGRGISKANAPFMAMQSYTSKIKDFCDLDKLNSYGFRGEALSSLCRIADVTIITKTVEDDVARLHTMDHDGSIMNIESSCRSIGTTVRVKNIFKDVPVRRQIMMNTRRLNQDIKSLENLLKSFAICQPKVRITFNVNDKMVMTKQSVETMKDVLIHLFGKKFISQVDFLEKELPEVTMQLIIPRKDMLELSDLCQVGQYVFANQRPVIYKDIEKIISKRLMESFGDRIPQKKKLPFLLSLDVPPSNLDVNLEPNKTSVLLVNQAMIMKNLDGLLTKYYGIVTKPQDSSNDRDPADMDSSLAYPDYSSMEEKITSISPALPVSSSKKRKIDGPSEKTPGKRKQIANKENCSLDAFVHEKSESLSENISQLPIVDLGEDFTAQDISNLPYLDPEQVQVVLGNIDHDNELPTSSNIKSEAPRALTEEAWSKGRVPINLHGGTDVQIYSNAIEKVKPKIETESTESKLTSDSTGCKGFFKFSKEMRPKIIKENPDINFVEMAKTLTAQWKQLSPEERGYYRDLAATDDANKMDQTRNLSPRTVKQRKVTNENTEVNKKRFLGMLENMKNTQNESKKEKLMMRTSQSWTVNMESVIKKCHDGRLNIAPRNQSIIVGGLNENVWLARTGFQIWALHLDQLYTGLCLEKPDCIESRETVEELIGRWLREKDGMSLLHPVFELQ